MAHSYSFKLRRNCFPLRSSLSKEKAPLACGQGALEEKPSLPVHRSPAQKGLKADSP
jgi:hypothetical protein